MARPSVRFERGDCEWVADAIDPETALETFVEFEGDIHRIAFREFVKRLGGEPPILLTSADLDG